MKVAFPCQEVSEHERPDRLTLRSTRAYGLLGLLEGTKSTHCPWEAGSQALWVKYLRLDEMATFQKSGAHLGRP